MTTTETKASVTFTEAELEWLKAVLGGPALFTGDSDELLSHGKAQLYQTVSEKLDETLHSLEPVPCTICGNEVARRSLQTTHEQYETCSRLCANILTLRNPEAHTLSLTLCQASCYTLVRTWTFPASTARGSRLWVAATAISVATLGRATSACQPTPLRE